IKKRRRKSGSDTLFSTVSNDVDRFALDMAKEAFDERMSMTMDQMSSLVQDLSQRKRSPAQAKVSENERPDKKIRFNQKGTPPPHPLLQIEPTDTPHTRALKLRRARLMRDLEVASSNTPKMNRVPHLLSKAQKRVPAPFSVLPGRRAPKVIDTGRTKKSVKRRDKRYAEDSVASKEGSEEEGEGDQENISPIAFADDMSDQFVAYSSPPENFDNLTEEEEEEANAPFDVSSIRRDSSDSLFLDEDLDVEDYVEDVTDTDADSATEDPSSEAESPPPKPAKWKLPKHQAELNFEQFEEVVKNVMGGKEIPKGLAEHVWSGQIRDRKKALDGRLYQRKVNMKKELSKFADTRPIKAIEKDIARTASTKRRKAEVAAQRMAKAELEDQKRRVIRMEKRMVDLEKDVLGLEKKRKMREEQLIRDMYKNYLSEQRKAIIETSRWERDQKKKREAEEAIKREAKERYHRDQIKLLEEKLENARTEEDIVAKAYAHEMRKLIREEKKIFKDRIGTIKQKLDVDSQDYEMQRVAAEDVKRNLAFA
ncbi:hypothetical protein HDV05_000569, partial [Chytridiales sp. JEL 0842]